MVDWLIERIVENIVKWKTKGKKADLQVRIHGRVGRTIGDEEAEALVGNLSRRLEKIKKRFRFQSFNQIGPTTFFYPPPSSSSKSVE